MVSPGSLKIKFIWIFIGVLSLAGSITALYVVKHNRGVSACDSVDDDVVSTSIMPKFALTDLRQEKELIELSVTVVEAYTNLQLKVMQQKFGELLEKSQKIPPSSYFKVIDPIRSCLTKCFLNAEIENFDRDLAQFCSYIELNRALIILFGQAEDRRKCYSQHTMALELFYLERLYGYRDCFRKQDLQDYGIVVDRLICEWIDRIDSQEGMTRKYILWDFEFNLELVRRGMETREHLVRGFRSSLCRLEGLLGRPPKWIDEIK